MQIPETRAYQIETERLVLRPFHEEEAAALREAVIESLDHLRRWLAWAVHEPETVEQKRERIRAGRARFESGMDLPYGVFDRTRGRVLGSSGLHDRGDAPQVREIGYWVHRDFVSQGFATELSAGLTRAGFTCEGAERIEIHCDPRNEASAAVPRKLGFRLREIRPEHRQGPDGRLREGMIWELRADEFEASAAASFEATFRGRPAGSAQSSSATP